MARLIDREKVIKGLECCAVPGGNCCLECPYLKYGVDENGLECENKLVADALELLKAQEPKPRESRAKLPCPKCGRKRLSVWISGDKDGKPIEAIACDKCKIASAWSKTEIGAIRDWNEMVRKWTE